MTNLNLDDSIGFLLGITQRRYTQLFLMRIKEFDLTPEQWAVLYRIQEKDGMIQKEIADRSSKDRPTTTRILDLLESKGYISKKLGKEDRRTYHIFITESGSKVAEAIAPIEQQVNHDATAILNSEERIQLIDMLRRLGAHVQQCIDKEKE